MYEILRKSKLVLLFLATITTIATILLFASVSQVESRRRAAKMPKDLNALVSSIQKGGYILLINSDFNERKYNRNYYKKKRKKADLTLECTSHNQYSEKQILFLQTISESFQKMKLAIDRVLHQPTCRSIKLAELLVKEPKSESNENLHYLKLNEPEHKEKLQLLLSTPPLPGSINILISNNTILPKDQVAKSIKLKGIAAVILLPLGNNNFKIINTIEEKEWQKL